MKFHTLDIQNFLTVSQARIALDDRGLHVIQGENKMDSSADSNGAGKSSLVDALSWVLFGVTARGIKGDSVVNRGAKKNTKVSLILSNGASVYEATRYRKHKEHKNALHLCLTGATHGETAVLTKGTDAETQKELEKILGCSQEVFLASVYAGQEAMPNLPAMTDRELKSLVEEAAGLQRIELAYQESRQRLQASSGKCQNLQFQFEETQRTVPRIVGNIEHQKGLLAQWDAERAEKVTGYQAQVAQAQREWDKAHAEATAGVAKRDQLNAISEKLRSGLTGHAALVKKAQDSRQDTTRHITLAGMLKTQRDNAYAQRQQAQQRLEQVKAGQFDSRPCSTCGTPPTAETAAAHRDHLLASAQQALYEAAKALDHANEVYEAKVREAQASNEVTKAALAAVPDTSEVNAKLNSINEALGRINALASIAQGAGNALKMAQGNLANYLAQSNPYTAIVERLQREETAANESMTQQAAAHAKELERYKVLEAVVQLYGPAGVRAHILDTVTPYLNERTADYLSALSDGAITATWSTLSRTAAGAVREKFTIEVTHAHGGDSFAAISGGEKRKVRLACALALQDLVASRATQPLDLFVGDEIDDALDPAGLERLMTILERKARERGTVLVISHNSLTDWCDQITTVSKVEEFTSTVAGSLCI